MSENELSVKDQYNPADDRPGHRLAEARKAKGLSLEEVASQLRLNVSMLQALENDDYSHLPPAAYVSGYVRSYARALGLSEAEVLRSNSTAPSGEPPIVGVVARSHTTQVQASDPRVKMVSWLVIGGLLFISGAWWLVQREESAPLPPLPETAAAPAAPAAEAVPAAGMPGSVIASGAPATVAVPATAPAPGAPAAAAPAATAARPVTPAPVPAKPVPATPAAAPIAPTAAATPGKPPAAEATPKPATPPPPPLTADVPQSKVVLEFTADCWVDVVDAAGRQLAYELATAGRRMKVHGEAPFTVFFGYSPGVQVTFNDQPYDHRPYQRKDVARFKLGTAEDNTLSTEAQ